MSGNVWSGAGFLLITALGWGLNWPAVRVLLREAPPLFSRGLTGLAAFALLIAIARTRGERLAPPQGARMALGFSAFTNVFAWMGFSTLAMRSLSVAECALLVYTMPIWAALFAWPVLRETPTRLGLVALTLSLAGIGLLFGVREIAFTADKLTGVCFALGAAILFALGAVTNRRALGLAPLPATAWQVGLGAAPMIALGLFFENADVSHLSARAWALLAYMTLAPMAASYLAWFAAVRRLGPQTASIVILITPLIGILSAAVLIGEPLGLTEALASLLVIGGAALALVARRA
jgi:drug/metabolite transporter (DMT)-like permease